MPRQRLTPEKLLQQAEEEERQAKRGNLKIYLGAAPGVGKTYMMLQDAIAQREQGLDILVGVAESHGRQEIEALLKKLEILPLQEVEYRERKILEFDIDGALKRNPGLILIDEMAHTNAPNLRHEKRWQDIKELLDRGINVYTTLNVQHIESLNDIVSQIIHIRIKETVPDFMLELANTIELVDLPPEDLLKRLQEGKIYFPQQAELAAENFFRKGNLIALRELALRVTAERVGAQVLLYRQGLGIQHIWPTKEKIVVCVGPGSQSTKLIRATKRMATNLQAEWIALYVETPQLQLSDEKRNSAIQNLRLAEQLGAQTQILTGFSVVNKIMNFSHEQNITKLIVGKKPRSRWKDILFGSLADEFVRNSGEIDVYIITSQNENLSLPVKTIPTKQTIPWWAYGLSTVMITFSTIIDFFLYPYLHESNLIIVYLFGIIIVSLCGQIGPALLTTAGSILMYSCLFLPPFLTFSLSDIQYIFTILVITLITIIISNLAIVTRKQAESSQAEEQRISVLHSLSRQLASTRGVDKLLETAVRYLSDIFNSEVLVLLSEDDHLEIRAKYKTEAPLSEKEQGVAQWVYDLGQIAGLGTDTLPFSDSIYVPLFTSQGTIGVVRLHPLQSTRLFTPEQMHLLEACVNQIALAIEVDRLQEQTKKSELQTETDRVRSTLLHSVSHDIRSPLIAVTGAASTLIEMSHELNASMIKKLGNEIYTETEEVSRLVSNLLQMTYLEAEDVQLKKQFYSLSDEINTVLKTLSKPLGKKPVHLHIPDNLPKVPFDRVLISEVLINLIDNAIKFTSPLAGIEISVVPEKDKVIISVEDRGPGIVQDEMNKLFEKFYRGRMLTSERGLGLGLAICRRVVHAHGGEIWAENCKKGGAAFRFTLPLHL